MHKLLQNYYRVNIPKEYQWIPEKSNTRKMMRTLEREIRKVTDVTEEEAEDSETTEGVEVDLLAALLELAGWEVKVKGEEEELS